MAMLALSVCYPEQSGSAATFFLRVRLLCLPKSFLSDFVFPRGPE